MKWSVNLKDKFYDKAELDSKFDALVGFTTLVVNSLPVTGENGIMYLLPSDESTESNNIYDEYIWVSDKFEKIGSTKTTVDLSGYVTQTEMTTQLANKANTNHTHDIASLPDETDMLGHMENDFYTALDTKADKTTATTSANGLMSKEDKSKLDGIATEANKTVVDSSLSSSSTNPVQNKIINSALNGKANLSHTHMGREIYPDFSVDSGGASTTAYRKILRITINSRYCDEPITFNLSQRNESMHNRVHIKFKSSTDTNPDLQSFYVEGIKSMPLYLYKESTSKWILLSKEVNNYDYVSISDLLLTNRNRDYFTFTPLNEQVTTLPTTNIYTAMNTVDSSLSSTSAKPVQNKVITNALNDKANSTHTHDDRYYTETEMNTKLNGKANSSHTHSIGNVTNLQSKLDTIPSLTSTSITVSGTDNQGTITFYKFGKIVVMELDLLKVHLTQTWNVVGTIPNGYMPKLSDGAGAPLVFWNVQGQQGQSAQLNIKSTGEIRFAYGNGETPQLHTYVTYIVD